MQFVELLCRRDHPIPVWKKKSFQHLIYMWTYQLYINCISTVYQLYSCVHMSITCFTKHATCKAPQTCYPKAGSSLSIFFRGRRGERVHFKVNCFYRTTKATSGAKAWLERQTPRTNASDPLALNLKRCKG